MREGRGDRADHLTGVAIESGVLIARSKKLMTFPIEGSGTSELALRVGGIYIYSTQCRVRRRTTGNRRELAGRRGSGKEGEINRRV